MADRLKTVYIIRDFGDKNHSLGNCYVFDENQKRLFKSESIERGWQDNKRRVSCIPEGVYHLELEYSARFKKELWEIKDVDGRDECKFHAANYAHQLNGCIALGRNRIDINGDGQEDVSSSKITMAKFHEAFGQDRKAILVINNIIQ